MTISKQVHETCTSLIFSLLCAYSQSITGIRSLWQVALLDNSRLTKNHFSSLFSESCFTCQSISLIDLSFTQGVQLSSFIVLNDDTFFSCR